MFFKKKLLHFYTTHDKMIIYVFVFFYAANQILYISYFELNKNNK